MCLIISTVKQFKLRLTEPEATVSQCQTLLGAVAWLITLRLLLGPAACRLRGHIARTLPLLGLLGHVARRLLQGSVPQRLLLLLLRLLGHVAERLLLLRLLWHIAGRLLLLSITRMLPLLGLLGHIARRLALLRLLGHASRRLPLLGLMLVRLLGLVDGWLL